MTNMVESNMSGKSRIHEQVDPGFHWAKLVVEAHGTRIFDVLAAETSENSFSARTEHWYGFNGGARALAGADELVLSHSGDYDWTADYPSKWNNSSSGRNQSSNTMATSVSYIDVGSSEPDDVYEGSITRNGTVVTVRLHIEVASDDSLSAVTWYHNGASDPAFIVESGETLRLTKEQGVSWPSGWKKFSYST